MSNIFDKEKNSTNTNSAQQQTEFNYSYDQAREPIGASPIDGSQNFFHRQIKKITGVMGKRECTLNTSSEENSSCEGCAIRRKITGFFTGTNAKLKRIIFFIILLIIILLLILWLKSSNNKTVESFEDGSMQFQAFQPINNVDPNPNNFEETTTNVGEPANKVITINSNQSVQDSYSMSSNKDSKVVIEDKTETVIPPTPVVVPVENKAIDKAKEIVQEDVLKQKQLQDASKHKAKAQPKVSQKTEKSVAVTKKPQAQTVSKGNLKIITIKKGMSLMQTFRNHGLNLKDLNAMVHTKNAGKALSRFQPGDKVRVTTDKNGHVETLTLKTGSSFIRQTNGSYIFLK